MQGECSVEGDAIRLGCACCGCRGWGGSRGSAVAWVAAHRWVVRLGFLVVVLLSLFRLQILCALLNQNAEEHRFAFLDARRVLIVADPPDGEVSVYQGGLVRGWISCDRPDAEDISLGTLVWVASGDTV